MEEMDYIISTKLSEFLDKKVHTMFVNGAFVNGSGSKKLKVINPATKEVFAKVQIANEQDVDIAVQSAKTAFKHDSWKKISPVDRERLLLKLADLIEENAEPLAELITMENGKLVREAKSSDVMGAAKTFRYYAGWATKLEGETIDISIKQKPGFQNFAFTRREPVGVVAAIVPWNFPISIAAWKVAPAIAAGCTVVLKPSEVTPLSALFLAELFMEAGFPPGVFNVLTGDGKKTGASLVAHTDISKITFTGSTETGKSIGKAAMNNLTGISLELGGKSPAIVFNDADLKLAAKGIAAGIFRNAGQVCVAGSRVYIQKEIYDALLTDICHEGDRMRISHGFDPKADIGPLASEGHLNKVLGYIEDGKSGSSLLCTGGEVPDDSGYYLQPTVFSCTDHDISIIQEEIFGPVLVAIPFEDMDDAILKANDTKYGLASTIWTKNINKAMHCIEALDAGFIGVNTPVRSDPNLPLGGYKQSGIGSELGKNGVYNYTTLKAVNIVY